MYCGICQKHIVHCTCPDIEERLNRLVGTAAEPAAMQNLAARKAAQNTEERQSMQSGGGPRQDQGALGDPTGSR